MHPPCLQKNKPEVVVSSILFLPHVHAALKSAGHKVPGDIGLISLSTGPHPGEAGVDAVVVTGVDPMARQMGIAAVNQLTAQLFRNERGLPEFPNCTTIPTQWVEGETL